MSKYILAIDQGTTSTRCILFNKTGDSIATAQKEIQQSFPFPGWVEHDPIEILESVKQTYNQVLKNAGIDLLPDFRIPLKRLVSQLQQNERG